MGPDSISIAVYPSENSGTVPVTVCLADDATGDTLSEVVESGSPLYGLWTYRVAATGQVLRGAAEHVSFGDADTGGLGAVDPITGVPRPWRPFPFGVTTSILFGAGRLDAGVTPMGIAMLTMQSPVVTSVTGAASGGQFRLKISGSGFEQGARVFIGSDIAPWQKVRYKADTTITLKGGDVLAREFPVGTPVRVRIVNVTGAWVETEFTRRN